MLIGHTLLAVQCGLWAAVTPLGLEAALRRVVEAGGDTDTNAAVAGAVLGARYGTAAIPGALAGVCARARPHRGAGRRSDRPVRLTS